MSDYIKREDVIKTVVDHSSRNAKEAEYMFSGCKSADVVEVVRCRECMHNGSFDTDCPFGWRDERFNLPDDIDFCSYGERKEKEHEHI